MNKRGVILIFSLLVTTVLSILLVSFYFQSISENKLAKRYADSVHALWLAEAGIAKVKSQLGVPAALYGNIDNPNYTYNVPTPTQIGTTDYYTVVSTGTVTSPSGGSVSRIVSVTMKLIPPDASKFAYCVETTSNDLTYKEKNLINTENPANIAKTDSTQTFTDLFGVTTATMEAIAQEQNTYFTDEGLGNTISASGITWVDVTPGEQLEIQHLNGDGIVVINGDFKLNGVAGGGGSTFNGILYVIGHFWMLGNASVNGTVFVESSADIGADLTGSSLVNYNSSKIAAVLTTLSTKTIVSWKEN